MIGLVSKNLRVGYITPLVILLLTVGSAALGVIIRNPTMHGSIVFGISSGFAAIFIMHFHNKGDAVWQKLESTMPIKNAHVEFSRYLVFVILFLVTLIFFAAYTLTNYLSGVLSVGCNCSTCICEICECTLLALIGNSLAGWFILFFLIGSILFPLLRLFSANNAFMAQIVTYVLAVVIFVGTNGIASRLDWQSWNWIFAAMVLTAVIFIGSFFLSLYIHKRKLGWEVR